VRLACVQRASVSQHSWAPSLLLHTTVQLCGSRTRRTVAHAYAVIVVDDTCHVGLHTGPAALELAVQRKTNEEQKHSSSSQHRCERYDRPLLTLPPQLQLSDETKWRRCGGGSRWAIPPSRAEPVLRIGADSIHRLAGVRQTLCELQAAALEAPKALLVHAAVCGVTGRKGCQSDADRRVQVELLSGRFVGGSLRLCVHAEKCADGVVPLTQPSAVFGGGRGAGGGGGTIHVWGQSHSSVSMHPPSAVMFMCAKGRHCANCLCVRWKQPQPFAS
jgi:hypothetical protein